MIRAAKRLGAALLWLLIAALLAITIAPAFLDHIYYRGPFTDHFDGARFENPDGEISFPVPPEGPPPPLDKVNNALTLFLTKKDAIYYYKDAFKVGETQITATNFKDVEKLLIELNKPTIEKINELSKQLNENKITEAVYDSLKNKEQGKKEALFVIIKPDKDARYRNMIDIVDEMDITGVGKYAVQDTIKADEQALLDIEKAKL